MSKTDDALGRALALLECLAIEPQIGPVLFVDLEPVLLPAFAEALGDLVCTVEPELGDPPIRVLSPWTTAEDLFLRLRSVDGRLSVGPGILVEDPAGAAPIMAIPNLAGIGLAVTQAFLTQADGGPASAELFGSSMRWQPRARWLAAASRADLVRMSPHLLDRFAARVDGGAVGDELATAAAGPAESADGRELIRRALIARDALSPVTSRAAWGGEATREVLRVQASVVGRRRDLALAQTAWASATLRGAADVDAEDVASAATLLGLAAALPSNPGGKTPSPDVSPGSGSGPSPVPLHAVESVQSHATAGRPGEDRLDQDGTTDGFDDYSAESVSAQLSLEPLYPESQPDALPQIGSLRAPHRGKRNAYRSSGAAIGVEPVNSLAGLHDLALAATVIRASIFQPSRRRALSGRSGAGTDTDTDTEWIVHVGDLRQFRRRATSGSTLVLVLDHSCLTGWGWPRLLAPHLSWAYHRNSAVTLIELGHLNTAEELAAHRIRARALVDPRVAQFAAGPLEPGRATPLAHALDLAAQELRRATRSGGPTEEIRLVVVTDGRGNVPLGASLYNRRPTTPVGRQGVEDALRTARTVRAIGRARIRCHVIGPKPDQYPRLLAELAAALGAELHLDAPGKREPA